MVDRADVAGREAPDWPGHSRGAKMLRDLPIISGVQGKRRQRPKYVGSAPLEVGCFDSRISAKINIEARRARSAQENADVVQVEIEVAGEVLLDEGDANGLPAKLTDVKTAARPDVGQFVARLCCENRRQNIV